MSYRFALDCDGAPVLLAAVADLPPSPEPEPDKDVALRATLGSVNRRRDAIVDAARTLSDLSPAGVEQLARQRWRGDRAITAEDVRSFSADARAQRVHDVVDALDFRIRRAVYGRAGTRVMHVSIPRGVVSKSLAALEREEMVEVFSRLKERGWDAGKIKRYGVRRFDKNGAMAAILSGEPKPRVEG